MHSIRYSFVFIVMQKKTLPANIWKNRMLNHNYIVDKKKRDCFVALLLAITKKGVCNAALFLSLSRNE